MPPVLAPLDAFSLGRIALISIGMVFERALRAFLTNEECARNYVASRGLSCHIEFSLTTTFSVVVLSSNKGDRLDVICALTSFSQREHGRPMQYFDLWGRR